jgi:hypothetical protein
LTELKKEIKPLSEWIKFELETTLIDPPEIELRLAPIYQLDVLDGIGEDGFKFKRYYVETILDCVKEWNVKRRGKIVPLTEEIKRKHLHPLLSANIKGEKILLANAIAKYAQNLDNFLKN